MAIIEKMVHLALYITVANFYLVHGEAFYVNSWAVQILDSANVNQIANHHGFKNHGKIGILDDVYHFELRETELNPEERHIRTSMSPNHVKSQSLLSDPGVVFAEQQFFQKRMIRTFDKTEHKFQKLIDDDKYNLLRVEQSLQLQRLVGCNLSETVVDTGLLLPRSTADELGRVTTDILESHALSHESYTVDVYRNDWGPSDNGSAIGGPGSVTKFTLKNGIERGRGGKGSIYVWANGNGGEDDDCAADGYASSIYTISVGAIGGDGHQRPYDEECSAKLVMVYVSDDKDEEYTTSEAYRVSESRGTGAAASVASYITALVLEANPSLTWRDVQYLIVYTANPDLTAGTQTRNGAGLVVSRQYGFGVMDAEAMVSRARHWINIPSQMNESILPTQNTSGQASSNTSFKTVLNYRGSIHYLEHVIAVVTVSSGDNAYRGDIEIELTSPSNTVSVLLHHRSKDAQPGSYIDWPFMSVMFWGEDPRGEWTLTVKTLSFAVITMVELEFYGVSSVPEAVRNIPEQCHADCKRGCAGNTSDHCDSCKQLRHAYTLECITQCPSGYTERNGYCFNASIVHHCPSTTEENVLEKSRLQHQHTHRAKPKRDTSQDNEGNIYLNFFRLNNGSNMEDEESVTIEERFYFGCNNAYYTKVYIRRNGYFSFTNFTGCTPFPFSKGNGLSIVAPFFTEPDDDFTVKYDIQSNMSHPYPKDRIDSINNAIRQINPEFNVSLFLITQWRIKASVEFQGILATDSKIRESYAIFVYRCTPQWKNHFSNKIASIGFVSSDGLYANYCPTLSDNLFMVACENEPMGEKFSNVVYKLTDDDCEEPMCNMANSQD